MRRADLSDKEYSALMRAFRAPALWALNILAAEVGFDAALDVCASREFPAEAEPAFQACGYTLRDLPHLDEIVQLMYGVRVRVTWRSKTETLQAAARRLGLSVREAMRALNAYHVYGSRIEGLHAIRSRSAL